LYEALPALYVAVGTCAALGLDPTGGKLSGLLLAIAGLVIFKLRRAYRR
jgi:hypothetical protein